MAALRIITKTLLWTLLCVLLLPVLLAAALYVPPVQRWAVQTAARYASEATGMQISIGRLGISFPLDLDLNRLVVIDKSDTLVAVDQAVADLDFEHVFHWRIGVEALDLSRGQVNIALRPDTTEKDTSKTQLPPLEVNIRRVALSDVRATFRTVGDTLSVFALLREATLSGGDIALGPSIYVVDRFEATVDSLSVSALDSLGQRSALFPPDLSPLSYPLTPFTVGLSRLSLTLEPLLRFSVGRFSLTTPSLCAALTAAGDLSAVAVDSLHVWLPDQVDLWGSGRASNLDRPDSLSARFDWDVHTRDLTPLARRLSIKDVALPPMDLNAFTSVEGSRCHIDAILNEGRGNVRLVGDYDTKDNSYKAQARINGLNVRDFLPRDSIGRLSASAKVQGRGTDPYDAATALAASLSLQSLAYGSWLIDNVEARASLRSHRATLDLQADNRLLKTDTKASAVVLKNSIRDARLDMQLERADLRALRLVKDTLSVAANLSATAATDFRERHSLAATLSDLGIETKDTVFHPLPLSVDARLTPDSIRARAEAGDLLLRFTSADGLRRLLAKVDNVNKYLKHQMDESMERHHPLQVDHDSLKTMLPTFDLNFLSGRDNTLFRIVQHLRYEFDEAALRLSSDPVRGINGEGHAYGITNGNVRLDTLQLHVDHDSKGFNLLSRLMNSRQNATGAFRALFSASLQPAAIETALEFYDAQGEKGIDLGLHIVGKDSALVGHITPQNPILAYRRFTVNPDNYIALDRKKHIRADFNLLADDGTQLMLFSPREQRDDVLQDLTLSVRRLNLGELCQVLPIVMPRVSGFLDGDIHALVVDTTEATVALGLEARDLVYEKAPLGTVGLDMVWMPNPDGTQVIDGQMTQNGREVLLLNGSYWKDRETKEDRIDATATLQRLPLLLANGFIPDNLITLAGYAVGHLSVTGPVSALSLNGALATDSMDIRSVPYSVHLALPRDTLHIDNSVIEMRNLRAFSVVDGKKGERPDLDVEHAMTLNGRVDCRDLNHIKLGLRVQAENFRLIDAPRNKKAQAYGKAYVDADVRLGGDLQKMRIGGKLRLLGKTDLTYVVTDTPLSADNKLDDLVTFVDFSDTTAVEAPVSNPMDIRLNLALAIDEAATMHVLLSEDGSDNLEIEGGGDLNFSYDPITGNRLFGRYTVLSGKLDYSLVVASLKDFKLHTGSYIEFLGDPLNPTLSLAASQLKKASVTEGKVTRSVNFDVGLKVTRNLKDLGLEFTIEAPEDLTCQQELSAMSTEQRGRVAVTLLATGMYVTDNYQSSGSGGGFTASGALNSFLQSQINSIAGKALKTVDIGFGMGNTTNAAGVSQTDYNFSFAKRFWGNRISVIVGGKVSSGNQVKNTGESIVNNISVEYRLDNSGTRYVRAFYDREYETLMEGTVTKTGAGLVFRRKTATLGELFLFRSKQ